jgi:hypothetical protein
VLILKVLKVLCFDTLLQVLILKVDSGTAGALAEFLAATILLQADFLGSAARKGVSGPGGYFMGYYTIWLAPVKDFFVPFWNSFQPGAKPKAKVNFSAEEFTLA